MPSNNDNGKGKGLVLFDVDGVVANFSKHMAEWKRAQGLPVDESKYYSPADTEWAELHDRFALAGGFLSMPVIQETLDVMHEVSARGYATGQFTARQSFTGSFKVERIIQRHTRIWVTKAPVPHPETMHFCGKELKCDLIVRLGAIAMVEDHRETACDIGQLTGVHGQPILSFLYDRAWNQEEEGEPKQPQPYIRFTHPQEILEHLP